MPHSNLVQREMEKSYSRIWCMGGLKKVAYLLTMCLPRRNSAEEYAINEGKVIGFRSPAAGAEDPLTELLRTGAQQLLQQAVEAELGEVLAGYADRRDAPGRQAVVRNGHLPAREILTNVR